MTNYIIAGLSTLACVAVFLALRARRRTERDDRVYADTHLAFTLTPEEQRALVRWVPVIDQTATFNFMLPQKESVMLSIDEDPIVFVEQLEHAIRLLPRPGRNVVLHRDRQVLRTLQTRLTVEWDAWIARRRRVHFVSMSVTSSSLKRDSNLPTAS